MTDKHQHIWLPVRTVLTGNLILYYDCQCDETISVAEHKRTKPFVEEDEHPQLFPGMNSAMLHVPPAKKGESDG